MKKLVMHVGHSKCASSTLQSFLSHNFATPIVDAKGEEYWYAAITPKGVVLRGHDIKWRAEKSPARHVSSAIDIRNGELFADSLREIEEIAGENDTVIISNEGWGNRGVANEAVVDALAAINAPINVFMITRPPVDWFNASWWQWGCWQNISIAEWFDARHDINFMRSLQQWECIESVKLARVVDVSQDPIGSFISFLGIEWNEFTQVENVNTSTDVELLRHLIGNKDHYNRTAHKPQIEFQLNNILQLDSERPPFVGSKRMAEIIIQGSLEDHKQLLGRMKWAESPLAESVAKKYLNEKCYEDIDEFDFDGFFNNSNNNRLVCHLVQRVIDLHSEVKAAAAREQLVIEPSPRVGGPIEKAMQFLKKLRASRLQTDRG